jgi:hypothetical protein
MPARANVTHADLAQQLKSLLSLHPAESRDELKHLLIELRGANVDCMCETYTVEDGVFEIHTLDRAYRITVEPVALTNKLTM